MLNRLKRLWKLSKKDTKLIDSIPENVIDYLPDEESKAVFIGQGTNEEFEDLKREESGLKAWYDRLKKL